MILGYMYHGYEDRENDTCIMDTKIVKIVKNRMAA
jgi:hypothetical protein